MSFQDLFQIGKRAAEEWAGNDPNLSNYLSQYQAAFFIGYQYSPKLTQLSLENTISNLKRDGVEDEFFFTVVTLAWKEGQKLRQVNDKNSLSTLNN
jgi:hypothetical protein